MALVLSEIYKYYVYAMEEQADPRVKTWFLLRNPIPMLTITVLYLLIILDRGPEWMKNRKPFDLNRLMIFYNAAQILACGFIVIEGLKVLVTFDFKCAPVDYSNKPVAIHTASIMWCYFMVKVIDLLDTIFFILRKKQSQVSFLHVYHHGGMVILSWCWLKFVGGGATLYVIVFNSFVHVIMYGYYLLCAYDKNFKTSAWWKKHITQLQLAQFGLLMSQHIYMLFTNCNYPKGVLIIYIIQSVLFLFLFGDFYVRTYVKGKSKKMVD